VAHLHGVFLETQELPKEPLSSWTLEPSEDSARSHIRALRIDDQDHILLLNGCGTKTQAKMLNRRLFEFEIVQSQHLPRPQYDTHVFLSPPKGEDLERCVQICVELGLRSLSFFSSDHNANASQLKLGRLKRIAISSCEQSLNPWIPELNDLSQMNLSTALAKAKSMNSYIIGFDEDLADKKDFFSPKKPTKNHVIFIGPEGGWSEKERSLLKDQADECASLGPIILKVPTALCASLSVLKSV
jgi:16S rRNA (uracil1498-N3)-methyltransferase